MAQKEKTVYVVEDDHDIGQLLSHHLLGAGYSPRIFSRASTVILEAEREKPALFLLDIMIPGGDGMDLCRRIRESKTLAMTPVMFLTAKSSEGDRISGLEMGADDYITKPFSPREVVARVHAVLRRFERPMEPSVIQAGDLMIDPNAMQVTVKEKPVPMTATEFRLLEYLARNAGRVFTRDQILDSVWRDTQYVTPRSVDVYVRKIREKIERDPENPRFVKTVRGAGYRFEVIN